MGRTKERVAPEGAGSVAGPWWSPGATADRPRRRLPSGRAVVGACLVVVAVGGVLATQRASAEPPGSRFLVVTRPVAAGATLRTADLGALRLDLPADVGAVPAARADRWVGRRARHSLAPMDLLRPGDLAPRGRGRPGSVEVAVEVPAGRLPLDAVRAGAAVDVLSTGTDGSGTSVLAAGASVLGVAEPGSGGIGGAGDLAVRLEVADRATAVAVVDAAVRAELSLVVPAASGGGSTRG